MTMFRTTIVGFSLLPLCILCLFIYIYHPRSAIIGDKPTFNSQIFYPYIAVLIEFRSTPLLVTIVMNVLQNIPSDWPIQIFHGQNNLKFIQNSRLSEYIKTNRIFLHQIDLMMKEGDAMGFTSSLLTNSAFWQMVKGEKILFFQLDSVFCSNSPHKLNDFLQYDYIGAPWHIRHKIPAIVGNGGFSLRSRNKSIALLSIRTYNRTIGYHEDVWFSKFLHLVNANIAPEHIARKFSVETVFYPTPLAVHKPIYLNYKELKDLCQACPDLRLVVPNCAYSTY